jgi:hypothetical protein
VSTAGKEYFEVAAAKKKELSNKAVQTHLKGDIKSAY